jgi:GAF domain-containing protein
MMSNSPPLGVWQAAAALAIFAVAVLLWRLKRLARQPMAMGAALIDPSHGPRDSAADRGEAPADPPTSDAPLERRVDVMETLGRLMTEVRDSADVREQIVVAFVDALGCQRGSLWELAPEGGYYVALSEAHAPDDHAGSVVGRQVTLAGNLLLHRMIERARPTPILEEHREMLLELVGVEAVADGTPEAAVLVPLFHFSLLFGFLLLQGRKAAGPFDEEDLAIANAAATYSALVLENLRNRIAEQQRGERMAALARLSATLTTRHNLDEVLPEIVLQGAALARSATCTVLLVEDDATLLLAAQVGLGEDQGEVRLPLSNPIVEEFIRLDMPLIVEDIDRDRPDLRTILVRQDVRSIHLFPLRVAGTVIGVLTLSYEHPNRPERA